MTKGVFRNWGFRDLQVRVWEREKKLKEKKQRGKKRER